MVTETDTQTSGTRPSSSLTRVPFPAPEGPETMNKFPRRIARQCTRRGSTRVLLAEALHQLLALTGAKALHAAALGDAEVLHDLRGFGLAEARKRLEKSRDLHPCNDGVIGLRPSHRRNSSRPS